MAPTAPVPLAALTLAMALLPAAPPSATAGPAAETPTEAWTMTVVAVPGDPRHAVADAYARCVRDASVGRLTLAPEPAPDPRAVAIAVRAGTPRLAAVHLADIPDPDPLFELETFAGLAADTAATDKLWTAARLDLERALAARGFAFVFSAAGPVAGLFLTRLPDSRDGLAELRLAAASSAGAGLLAALGVAPAAIGATDSVSLAAALRDGRLDGFAAEPTAEAAAAASTGMTFLDLAIVRPREVIVANRAAFDALPADGKTALVACGDKAKAEASAAAASADAAARAGLAARGIATAQPSPALAADIAAHGAARLADWLQRTGVTGKAILDSFRAM